jgi:hypothetical protein
MSLAGYYDQSYPPSILNYSTGANAGIPGTWTPAGSIPPDNVYDLAQGHWVEVVANPQTQWTTGQYVTLGDGTRATWSGTAWVGGVAPLESEASTESKTFEAIPVDRSTIEGLSDESTQEETE